MIKNLKGKVALITGASRGIGKGIAQVLVEAGATVYITGRLHSGQHEYKSVIEIAEELNSLNIGKCVGLICDHKIDEQTQNVFDKIKENENSLDILVNNAFGGLDAREEFSKNEFWETVIIFLIWLGLCQNVGQHHKCWVKVT
ncbi:hypothetical protein HZS_6489 [Henneguya salminicola]|nr:hypothetical protein HZS_6489 [Henneguya salminicola]